MDRSSAAPRPAWRMMAACPKHGAASDNVAWKIEIPGRGWSSPVVAGDRIFLTSVIAAEKEEAPKKGLYFGGNREAAPADEHRWMVYCVDWKTGKLLWEREVHRGNAPARHLRTATRPKRRSPMASASTPISAAWACSAWTATASRSGRSRSGRSACATAGARPPRPCCTRAASTSSTTTKSNLSWTALDAKTGKQIWRVARDEGSNWATPYVWESGRRTEIVTAGHAPHPLLRSGWQAALGTGRHVVDRHPYAVFETRPALCNLRLCGRPSHDRSTRCGPARRAISA